ncbi:MAG: hypothetical protein RIB67_03860 [Miltoncostaeaceae bacterium]
MKRIASTLAALVLAALLAFGLVACGDDDDEADAPATTAAMEADAPAPTAATPAADLRVTLDRLLGEHAVLAMNAMQKGHDGAEDFDPAVAAVLANSDDLAAAVGSVYGEEAGSAFLELWNSHINFFVDYTVATAGDDEAGREAAQEDLAGYRSGFAAFLAGANPNLPEETVDQVVGIHVGHLSDWMTAYNAGDHETAADLYREAYAHMFVIGDALSGAIVAQFPENFQG